MFENFFEGIVFLWKRGRTQSLHFCNFDLLFPPKDGILGKTSAIRLFKYVKIKFRSSSFILGKIRLLFARFVLFLAGNRARSQFKGSGSKFDRSNFTHTIPGQLPKKRFVPALSTYAASGHKGYHTYIFETIKLDCLMQNLMLERLAPISSPKN